MKMVNLKVWTAGETANNFQRFLRFCLSQCVSFEKFGVLNHPRLTVFTYNTQNNKFDVEFLMKPIHNGALLKQC